MDVRDDLDLVGDHGLPCQIEGLLEDAIRRGRFRRQRDIARGAAREGDVRRGEAADGRVGIREKRHGALVPGVVHSCSGIMLPSASLVRMNE